MLDGLFVTPAVALIDDVLATLAGPVAVVGSARLAKAVGARRPVVAVELPPRAARKHDGPQASLDELAARRGTAEAVVAIVGVLASDARLAAWARVVPRDGLVIAVDRGGAVEASRRALCAGLRDLEQRASGRLVVTSGRVFELP